MTPWELRRLADRKIDESHSLLSDVDRMRAEASRLPGLLDPLIDMSREAWRGPAAEEFEANVGSHGRTLAEHASLILRIADDVEDRARRLRVEADSLRERAFVAEAAARTAAVAAAGGGV